MSFIKKNLLGGYDKKSAEQYIKMIKQNADKAESDYLKQIADLKAEIISLKSSKPFSIFVKFVGDSRYSSVGGFKN